MHSSGTSVLPASTQVLRPAKNADLRMTGLKGNRTRKYPALANYFPVHDVTAPVDLLQRQKRAAKWFNR